MMNEAKPTRIIVGITGATGTIFGVRLLQMLHGSGIETHMVMSKWAARTLLHETPHTVEYVKSLATFAYSDADQGASVASGSFLTDGMIVAPCSVRTLAAIANGYGDNLVHRAADVILKERRKLVLMVRETPLHTGHLRTMTALSEIGAIIAPPVPAFYAKSDSLADMVEHTVGRVLDLLDIDIGVVRRWGEDEALKRRSPRKIAP